jgi:hypothetical protein
VADWLEGGLPGRSERTRSIYREALIPLLERIGAKPLRELTARDVRKGLEALGGRLPTRYLQIARASLARAIWYAEADDLVGRNVATLVHAPKGQMGRPSRSLTLEQSLALLEAAREFRLNAYVVLSLTVGIRTEEARELHWDHVDLDGDPGAVRPVPPSVAVCMAFGAARWRHQDGRVAADTSAAPGRRAGPQGAPEAAGGGPDRVAGQWPGGLCGELPAEVDRFPPGDELVIHLGEPVDGKCHSASFRCALANRGGDADRPGSGSRRPPGRRAGRGGRRPERSRSTCRCRGRPRRTAGARARQSARPGPRPGCRCGSRPGGLPDSPVPRWSGATTKKPRARAGMISR